MTYIVLRIGLGIVFVWASWDKLLAPAEFAVIIDNYRLLPPSLINSVAVFLPWLELICGLALIGGVYVRGSLLIINLMLIVFTIALVANAFRGVDIDCGCFSVSADTKGRIMMDIGRDIGLMAVGMWLYYMRIKSLAQR
jgi:uncharacterized membrane protein YphA (DoxX/SURF4 family)